ncbi:hypothetical protein HZP42_04235 [Elizabethkingia anophelis]|nr:hypothetical protein [Elizabethkingia anophelis]
MRKILLSSAILSVALLSSCRQEDNNYVNRDDVNAIAQKYGFTMSTVNSDKNAYKVNNLKELENALKSINAEYKREKYSSINIPINATTIKEYNQKLDASRKELLRTSLYTLAGVRGMAYTGPEKGTEGGPVGTSGDFMYTSSFNIDNTFPASNIRVTVNYNMDRNGNVTGASVNSTTWGYSLGNEYSQTNVTGYYRGQGITFQVSGQMTTTVGVGDYSIKNSNPVNITGIVTVNEGGIATGWVKQSGN